MNVRLATCADVAAIMQIERAAKQAAHWSVEKYEEIFGEESTPRIALVVEQDSLLCGFLIGRLVAGEWEIENIAVALSVRRRGLGAALLDEFLRQAREAKAQAVFLEVRQSNLEAQALYERVGFQKGGQRAGYYHAPEEEAVLYRLGLL